MSSRFRDAVRRRVVLFDGAMGTSIHPLPLTIERDYAGCENCVDILSATRPDVIQTIHETFLEAGADAVETNTFGGSKLVLTEFGIAGRCFELGEASARIARRACEKFSTPERPRFVAGSMGPGTKLITLGQTDWDALVDAYRELARGLIAGGADVLVVETCQDLLQVKGAINACLDALADAGKSPDDIPIMASVTIETSGTMLMGSSIEAVVAALRGYPILSLGLNCATGPAEMAEHVRYLARAWAGAERFVSVMPNAGLPSMVDGRAAFPLTPADFARAMRRFVEEDGVRIVGGCCGTTPAHIAALALELDTASLGRPTPEPAPPACASLFSAVPYRQELSYLIVGERLNASGSRKFKQLLEAEDWDGIVSLAREQVRDDGAHVLDINVDQAGRDNPRDMREIVRRVVRQVDAPLMLDSTQPATIEAGLRAAPGKCIINSANFEDGPEKFATIVGLARRFGAALVIGSIDEDPAASMARTADRKLAIARRGVREAACLGLAPSDVFIDPLVLPVSTGMESDRRSALETIKGVRAIARELPECQIVVGLSNVSFGLSPAARVALNSAFLHELREAGLTAAIVHASKILPRDRIPPERWDAALDLIHDRRDAGDPLQRFIDLFAGESAARAASRPGLAQLPIEERLRRHIIDGEKRGLAESLDEARRTHAPLDIINDHLLDGMKTVGELFGAGRMQLPFVLQSAEVMKQAVDLLKPHLPRAGGTTKGRVVLATVKGDVHDIGKNLVDIILTNNGYTVRNLGIKQPIADIVAAWEGEKADAIGLSGLLVKSVMVMEQDLLELNARGITAPVLVGGAALSRHYAEGRLREVYEGECFYGKDAFEGLRIMEHLVSGRSAVLAREIDERNAKRSDAERVIEKSRRERAEIAAGEAPTPTGARSAVSANEPVPTPPFWGSRVVEHVELDEVYAFINTVALFRGQWQYKKGALDDAAYQRLIRETVEPVFERVKSTGREFLEPRVVFGYFPCNADGQDLVIWEPPTPGKPPTRARELERFTFPRQRGQGRLCIADYFRPVESGEIDMIGMSCVTMGPRTGVAARERFTAGDYAEYLHLHGLGVEAAEALAELWHQRMRRELGIAGGDSANVRELFTQHYQGSRYSFGYPACPDMSDQEKLWRLLRPERIGCVLTENHQIDPEQSTSAIVVHHREARYFAV